MLTRAGLQIVGTVNNGKTAVEVVLREQPDIVVMDIRMPIMDGFEATQQILETYPVCVVMLTAFSDEDYQAKARAIGSSGYIVKPVTSSTLISTLERSYLKFQRSPE